MILELISTLKILSVVRELGRHLFEVSKSQRRLDRSAATGAASSKSLVEILDLTADDATAPSSKKDSSPFLSPVVSYFPRKDGRPRRSTSVASELRMRESLERELAYDDFMLGLTSEGSVAKTLTPPQSTVQATITPAGVTEPSTDESVTTEPSTVNSSVEAQVPPESSSVETPGGGAAESKEHSPPLDFASLALMYYVKSSRNPWRVLFDGTPNEPLTFSLGKFVKGVRISIRASGLGGLVRMWRRFSGRCYEDNEKIDLCVDLWERRHWLQVSSMDNAIQVFRKTSDPLDPFTRVVLSLCATSIGRGTTAWISSDSSSIGCGSCISGGSGILLTEVLLEPRYLQCSMEVLEWAPATADWSRELRMLDAEQPWRNCWIDDPAEHPYNTTYAPCNPGAPVFVPSSMTRQAVISGIVVDQSLTDAELVAPWIDEVSAVSKVAESSPTGVAKESSVDAETAAPPVLEAAEALNEDSFSFVPVEPTTSGPYTVVSRSSAALADVETSAHDK
ncbi:LOW QUALITY PROTEIN: hypothetical protein PHMEG_00013307 [Phytophthora megakarya]|uniref:Uncharacterized protein n=1 Tax=Phytophthora megakarya TaxID=4795 RepID=A0A225W971_9STRA|nr:LOW QUALITY PROTEIN: hypothetical protein PHMEG_00013307 [Phytophthora megakarya]